MKTYFIDATVILICVFTFSNCSSTIQNFPTHRMYNGPELQASQVSFIQINDSQGWYTTFRTIDGKRPPAGTRKIAVLPGKHNIIIDVVLTETSGGITSKVEGFKNLELDAIAGKEYIIKEGTIH
jgi:hypothetical protein